MYSLRKASISILTVAHPPLDGRVFHKEAVSLTEAGHKVTLIAPYEEQACDTARQCGIQYIPLQNRRRTRWERLYRWFKLFSILKDNSADVWHFHDPELLPLTILFKWILGKRVRLVYDVHEDVPKDILIKKWIPSRLRPLASSLSRYAEQWGIPKCGLVVSATDAIASSRAAYARDIVVVRNYPLQSKFKPASHNPCGRPVRAIYLGVAKESRGIRTLVEVARKLAKDDIELVILGGVYPESLNSEIRSLQLPNLKVLEKVPFEKVGSVLEESDIGILCLPPLPQLVESLPIKLFEYMQAGLPVVASNFPLWETIIKGQGCGLLVDPTDADEVSIAIRKLASDPSLRQQMGQAGRAATYQLYSWETQERVLLDAYQRLLGD